MHTKPQQLLTYFFAALLLTVVDLTQAADRGKLLIAGGALRSDNAAVYRAFLEAMPDKLPEVAVVPAASGRPAYYAEAFRRDLRQYGFEGDIHVLPVAVKDDAGTAKVDESTWSRGAYDRNLVERLDKVGAVWFVGGDQTRITETLLQRDGGDTPLLAAIRRQLARGAVVGGTSAGAAIMSRTMIAAGDSLSALTLPAADRYAGMQSQESGRLVLKRGLGFFETGIVDQHFDRKSRLGRLVRALASPLPKADRRGFGVDEDTAVLVELDSAEMRVLGRGNLVLLDAREAEFGDDGGPFSVRDIRLSLFSAGDSYNWKTSAAELQGSATVDSEAFSYKAAQGAGIALPNSRLDHLLGFSLVDNSETTELRRYTFNESGRGVQFRFIQDDDTQGFWHYGSGTKDQYGVRNVRFSVEPVMVEITR